MHAAGRWWHFQNEDGRFLTEDVQRQTRQWQIALGSDRVPARGLVGPVQRCLSGVPEPNCVFEVLCYVSRLAGRRGPGITDA